MTFPFHILLFCLAVLASGCMLEPKTPPLAAPTPAEQQLFLRFIDELVNDHPPAALLELERLYPQRPHTQHARTLSDAFAKRQQQIIQAQKDKSRCQSEKDRLSKELRQLQDDQEKLRKLVVEMEKRRR